MTALDILDAVGLMNDDAVMEAASAMKNYEQNGKIYKKRKLVTTILVAAVITALLAISAYASGLFSIKGRAPKSGELFTATVQNREFDIEGKYVFEFDGPEECRAVRFKASWAPSEDYWGFVGHDEDGWASLLEANELYNEEYNVYQPACVVDVMYAPEFINGGALLVEAFEPGEVKTDNWNGAEVYQFEARALHAMNLEGTAFATGNYVLLFYPDKGCIIGVRGYDSMENMVKIAQGIEIMETDTLIRSSDFESKVQNCDIYIG